MGEGVTTGKLWGGRFSSETDALMKRFNDSIAFDIRLWDADIRGSMAYADALARAGVITEDEAATLVRGLRAVHEEFAQGRFAVQPDDEDIHTAVERRLKEIVGEVAGKLHTGRSRNDQVATDMRLFALDAIRATQQAICDLQSALIEQAQLHPGTLMPGYTHLQRAQPITFAHWCLSYFWQLARDVDRLDDCARRTAVSPLGSGALAGNPFAVDREALAAAIGFLPPKHAPREARDASALALRRGAVSQNSLDAVSDRDFVAELLFCCAMIGVHLSRLAEDLIVYSTAEFGFVTFDDAYATGSSLMPQKKNPDAMELTRGKAGRLIGNLMSLLTTLKGLPMSYNKDLQEDKEPLFDSLDRMRAALDPAMLATDVAEYLVRRGLPFREAHHISGRAVALAERRGVRLSELSIEDWRSLSPYFDADILDVFDFERSISSRDVIGGTSLRSIRAQIRQARRWLKRR